jgi:hypothetical protein
MKITLTLGEIMDKGLWDKFCELKEWNVWCVSEGLAEVSETVDLTMEECERLGLKI